MHLKVSNFLDLICLGVYVMISIHSVCSERLNQAGLQIVKYFSQTTVGLCGAACFKFLHVTLNFVKFFKFQTKKRERNDDFSNFWICHIIYSMKGIVILPRFNLRTLTRHSLYKKNVSTDHDR